MIGLQPFLPIGVVAATLAAARPAVPADLTVLMAKARVGGTLVNGCRGQLRVGRPSGYAVAIASAGGGGRYLVVEGDSTVVELAPYKKGPHL